MDFNAGLPNKPRRITIAILVALVALLTTGAVLTVVNASNPAASLPESFQLEAPRIGGGGIYEATFSGPWVYADEQTVDAATDVRAPTTPGEPVRFLAFEWRQDAAILDGTGQNRPTNVLVRTHPAYDIWADDSQQAWTTMTRIDHFDHMDRTLVASSREHNSSAISSSPIHPELPVRYQNAKDLLFRHFHEEPLTDCILRNPLQGQTSDPAQLPHLPAPCRIAGMGVTIDAGTRMVAREMETVEGSPTLRVSMQDQDSSLDLWLVESVPYPVRVEASQQVENGAREVRLELVGFQVGDSPMGDGALNELPPAPAPAETPAQIWGPSDEGLHHRFPPSEMWERVQTDARAIGVRQFLQENPDAYVARLELFTTTHWAQGQMTHLRPQWFVTLTDGQQGINFSWAKHSYTDHVSALPDTYEFFDNGEFDARGIHPMDPPARLPTWGSLVSHWLAYASADFAGGTPSFARYSYDCADDCHAPTLSLDVGDWNYNIHKATVEYDPPGVRAEETREDISYVSIRNGFTWLLTERQYSSQDYYGAPLVSGSDSAPTALAADAQPVASFLRLTSTQAAGAGLLSILVGVIYWSWPALKTAPAMFFTRVPRDALIEHPVRHEIMDTVQSHPGVHFQDLLRRVGISNGAGRHHVVKLLQADLLKEYKENGFSCYYPARGTDRRIGAGLPHLKSPGARNILNYVQRTPGATLSETARAAGLAPSTVHHHVAKLKTAGLLEARSQRGHIHLHTTRLGKQAGAMLAA